MSLVRVNAGKVQYDESTKRCTPLPQKGVITIRTSADEESFYDFKWAPKSQSSGNVEADDLLIIPGDVTFKQVVSCKSGRVFALTFLSSGAKHLYWFQDVGDDEELNKLTEKDEIVVKKINELIVMNDDEDDEDEEEEVEDVKVEQQVPTNNYNNLLISSIGDVITPEIIEKHLSKLSESQLKELYGDYLPENTGTSKQEIMEVIRSGFFQQSSSKLSEQLRDDNGIGFALAETLKIDYQGEGIVNFMNSMRNSKKESEQDAKKDEDK